MSKIDLRKIHLINRLTFGPNVKNIDWYLKLEPNILVQQLFKESKTYKPFTGILAKSYDFRDFVGVKGGKEKTKRKHQFLRQKQRLNKMWLDEMVRSKSQLREKIAFFWHDHFATNVLNPLKAAHQINIIRKYSLGSFKTMLFEVSKSPAMIDYLNNKENIKGHPNENFAREILELFTLGVGNYSEKDIQEAARAFTGWQYTDSGKFYLDETKHDDGIKEFFGQKGRWNGDDILNILLDDQRTAKYIVSKLYFYLTGSVVKPYKLEELAKIFYSNYSITKLIKKIVLHDDFFTADKIGTRIKSPIELVASLSRIMLLSFNSPSYCKKIQLRLDQILLQPPNVSGWVSGKQWINVGTLVDRLHLASDLYNGEVDNKLRPPSMSDEGDELILIDSKSGIKSNGMDLLEDWFNKMCRADFYILGNILFSCNTLHIDHRIKALQNNVDTRKTPIQNAIVNMLCFPEYQMN